MEQEPTFDEQVDFMVNLYKDWITNIQRDAYARNAFIPAEVIAEAFDRLREHYDILSEESDSWEDQIKKILGEDK